jgi:hypothetical protein
LRKGLFILKHECKIINLKIVLFIVKIIGMNFGINGLDKLLGLYVILNLKRLNYSIEKLFLDCFYEMRLLL